MVDMGFDGGFDAQSVEPNARPDALPAGYYTVCIIGSEMKSTKAGDGRYLELELQVMEGDFAHRTLFDRLNLENPNAKAVEIARGTLSSICRAVRVLTPRDSAELHDKPLLAKVKIRRSEEFGDRNEIAYYKPVDGTPTALPSRRGPNLPRAMEHPYPDPNAMPGQADPTGDSVPWE